MSNIADPIREYVDANLPIEHRVAKWMRETEGTVPNELLLIADAIDAEHENQMVESLRHERSLAHKVTHGNGEYGHTTCSACGVTVHRRDKWCWSCGARLSGELEVRNSAGPRGSNGFGNTSITRGPRI